MKRLVFLFTLGLAFMAAPIVAQTINTTVIWGRNLPHVDVTVINETTDWAPVQASVDNQYVRGVLDEGEQHIWRFDQTAFGWNGPMSVEVRIEVCRSVMSSGATPIFAPPEWAMNRQLLGDSAITDAYLQSSPSEASLEKRVDLIKKTLNDKGVLGKKTMEKDLSKWLKFCRKYGRFTMGASCSDVAKRFTFPVDVTETWGARPYIIRVKGGAGSYFIDQSGNNIQ